MQFAEVVRRRRMVRSYDQHRPVCRSQLDALVELAVRAPSAGFSQGWEFLVLETHHDVQRYWRATTDPIAPADSWLRGMQSAPALILALSDKERYLERYAAADKGWGDRDEGRWPIPYWHVDTGMAALLMLLGAVDAGLGACFFGVPSDAWAAVRAEFGIPQRLEFVGAISVGYTQPDKPSPSLRRGRRSADEVTHYGRFSG